METDGADTSRRHEHYTATHELRQTTPSRGTRGRDAYGGCFGSLTEVHRRVRSATYWPLGRTETFDSRAAGVVCLSPPSPVHGESAPRGLFHRGRLRRTSGATPRPASPASEPPGLARRANTPQGFCRMS